MVTRRLGPPTAQLNRDRLPRLASAGQASPAPRRPLHRPGVRPLCQPLPPVSRRRQSALTSQSLLATSSTTPDPHSHNHHYRHRFPELADTTHPTPARPDRRAHPHLPALGRRHQPGREPQGRPPPSRASRAASSPFTSNFVLARAPRSLSR